MTRKYTALFALLILVAAFSGCRSRTDRSEGAVLLSVTDFDELPAVVSVSRGPFSIGEITVRNIPKDPLGSTSDLQSVEIRSYEVVFVRRDSGRRVPPPLSQSVFGLIPAGGDTVFNNLPLLTSDQLLSPPLSDLARTGVDSETGSRVVVLDARLRFFGRTLAGDNIVSSTAPFTIEVVP